MGGRDEFGRLAHQHRVAEGHRVVAGEVQLVDRRRPVPLHGRIGDVLGQVDQDGTRPTRCRHVEGGRHDPRDFCRVLDQPIVLGDAHGDARDVALLEGVGPDGARRDLTRHHDERGRVHVGVGQRCHDVRGTGAAGDHRHPRLAGDHRVPLGHVSGALLVADQDVADGGVDDRVVDGQDGPAGQAEHDVDPLHLEALDEGLCPSHLHVVPLFRCVCILVRIGPELKRPPGAGGREARVAMWARAYVTSTRISGRELRACMRHSLCHARIVRTTPGSITDLSLHANALGV